MKCDLCVTSLSSRDALTVHRLVLHGIPYCHECRSQFDSVEDHQRHDEFLHLEHRCSSCSESFKNLDSLQDHLSNDHQIGQCHLCELEVESDSYHEHLTKSHKVQPGAVAQFRFPAKTFTCPPVIFPPKQYGVTTSSSPQQNGTHSNEEITCQYCDHFLANSIETFAENSENGSHQPDIVSIGDQLSYGDDQPPPGASSLARLARHLLRYHQCSVKSTVELSKPLFHMISPPSVVSEAGIKSCPLRVKRRSLTTDRRSIGLRKRRTGALQGDARGANRHHLSHRSDDDDDGDIEAFNAERRISVDSIVLASATRTSLAACRLNGNVVDNSDYLEVYIPPEEEYSCQLCSGKFDDGGLHMIFKHNYERCRGVDCYTFCRAGLAMSRHRYACASCRSAVACEQCGVQLAGTYELVVHRSRQHNLETCVLCPEMTFSKRDTYLAHLARRHAVNTNRSLHNSDKMILVNDTLAIFKQKEQTIECLLCSRLEPSSNNSSSPFTKEGGGTNGQPHAIRISENWCGTQFYRHLNRTHRVQGPQHMLPQLFRWRGRTTGKINSRAGSEACVGTFSFAHLENGPDAEYEELTPSPEQNGGSEEHSNGYRYRSRDRLQPGSAMDPATSHVCIVCRQKFPSSETVQEHLIKDHFTAAPPAVTRRTLSSSQKDNLENSRTVAANNHVEEIAKEEPEDITNDCLDAVVKSEPADHAGSVDGVDQADDSVGNEEEFYPDPMTMVHSTLKSEPPEEDEEEEEYQMEEYESYDSMEGNDHLDSTSVIGKIGKAPVFHRCEICGVTLASIVSFTHHMKKEHKGSDLERNKPFQCELCPQSFYFTSSLNSHMSKAHQETSGGVKFTCPICFSVTNSKNGMRRHLRNSHKHQDEIAGALLKENNLSFSCNECGELFVSNQERKLHVAEKHADSVNVLKCNACSHLAPNKNALRRHCARMHPDQPLEALIPNWEDEKHHKCSLCPDKFLRKYELTAHLQEMHANELADENFECDECQNVFKTKKELTQHRRSHSRKRRRLEKKASFCKACKIGFANPDQLAEHDCPAARTNGDAAESDGKGSSTNSTPTKKPKKLNCKFCKASFKLVSARTAHYREVHPNMHPYVCQECGAGFVTKSGIYNHKASHRSVGELTCPHCFKSFTRRDSFKEHKLIHLGPRHKCPHCPKEFVQKSNLKRHIRIHLGIKPYKCNICESAFSDKGAYNSHVKIHDGAGPEKCHVCGLRFTKKQKLKYHMRMHTGEGLKDCQICGKTFTHSYALNSHVRTHQRDHQFMCYLCKESKIRCAESLFHHLVDHRQANASCSKCKVSFGFLQLLNRHNLAVHMNYQGYVCTKEMCEFRSDRLTVIRTHVKQQHSIKTPEYGINFRDEYREKEKLEDEQDRQDLREEKELATIYEGLDPILDSVVFTCFAIDSKENANGAVKRRRSNRRRKAYSRF